MGFLDRIFKKSNSDKEEVKNSKDSSHDVSIKKEPVILDFSELDNLIHSKREININSDIFLSNFELNRFSEGILIDVDGIVIDGNNNSISSGHKSRIFNITAKNVIIKNLNFNNAMHAELGAAIYVQKGASCIIENCSFKNNVAYTGGAILNLGNLLIKGSKFNSNTSEFSGGAITNMAELNIEDSQFGSNKSMGGGAIQNHYDAILKVSDSEFSFNKGDQGGAIFTLSKFEVTKTRFNANDAKYGGGAINSSEKSSSLIIDCKFTEHEAMDGGAILNMNETTIRSCKFEENHSLIGGGCVHNLNILNVEDCEFLSNKSDTDAGAIYNNNGANLNLKNSKFLYNSAVKQGGALILLDSTSDISNIEFKFNGANLGGAVLNFGKTKIHDSLFEANNAGSGSGINNHGSAALEISKTEFIKNSLKSNGDVITNDSDIKFMNCKFSQNETESVIISNQNTMLCVDSVFEDNSSKLIIDNQMDSTVKILGGKIINNRLDVSAICSSGDRCLLDKTLFENNSSKEDNCSDIYNKTSLYIQNPKFKDSTVTIFNEGHIDASSVFCDDLMPHIDDHGTVDCIHKEQVLEFGFLELDNLIHQTEGKIILENDISIGSHELSFYEGGIDLDIDDLVIDGQGRSIDGASKSRIFNVCAKNITLKNIVFKNGRLFNYNEEGSTGGGAIKVSKGASLIIEECKFEGNDADDKGGVILNNGKLDVLNSIFENNNSKTYGGAIFNHDTLKLENCKFNNNNSEMAGAIFNNGQLYLEDNQFTDNKSNISQPIFNNDSLQTANDLSDLVYNVGELNKVPGNIESFAYLDAQIRQNSELKLNCDIKFDNKSDYELRKGIEITRDLILDGNGHFIDGDDFSSLFSIINDKINVILKNITFKNAYSATKSIIVNKASLTLENCKFINNKTFAGLISNENSLKIIGSTLSANFSDKNSLIRNFKEVEINDSSFIINSSRCSGTVLSSDIPKIDENLKYSSKASVMNSCFDSNYSFDSGGAISNGGWSILNIENTIFINNRVYNIAGAIHNSGELKLKDSLFDNNHARYAGAINSGHYGNLNISNTKFRNNSSKNGGAIYNGGEFILKDSLFENNNAHEGGGALSAKHAGLIVISNTEFIRNFTEGYGGAIVIQEGADKFSVDSSVKGVKVANYTKVNISDSKFENNSSKNNGGAVNAQNNVMLEISNSEFIENESDDFGGAVSSFGSLKVTDSKFSANKASNDAGAIITSSEVTAEGCEFSDNSPNDIKRGL